MNTPLRNARVARNETSYTVAAAVGIDQSHYSRIENGKKRASADLVNRIAKYFDNAVTRDQILFPEDYIPSVAPVTHPLKNGASRA